MSAEDSSATSGTYSSATDATGTSYDPLEFAVTHSESKYLKNKDSVKVVPPPSELKLGRNSDPESPVLTPRDPKSSLFINTNRSSTYTVNLQAPNTDIPEAPQPRETASPQHERRKVDSHSLPQPFLCGLLLE